MIFIIVLIIILIVLGVGLALLGSRHSGVKAMLFSTERDLKKALEGNAEALAGKAKAERIARKEQAQVAELRQNLAQAAYALRAIDNVRHGVTGIGQNLAGVGRELHDLVEFIAELAGAQVEPGRHTIARASRPEIAAAPEEDWQELPEEDWEDASADTGTVVPHIHRSHVGPPVGQHSSLNGATSSNGSAYYVAE